MIQINLTVYEKNDLIRILDYAKAKKLEESNTLNAKVVQFDVRKINNLQKLLNGKNRDRDYDLKKDFDVMEGI